VHPIERLRMVARAAGEGPALLAQEAAGALAAFGDDPAGLVTACRRLVDRQPTSGPFWWLSARVLGAGDPVDEAWRSADELHADCTSIMLSSQLPEGAVVTVLGWPEQAGGALYRRGDARVLVVDAVGEGHGLVRRLRAADLDAELVPESGLAAAVAASTMVLLEASALGPTGFVTVTGARAAAAVANHARIPVWVVAGVGRVLPGPLWDALSRRLDDGAPWHATEEIVPLDLVDKVVGPEGLLSPVAALSRADCPAAPELMREIH
jgi:hypothetical protein